MCRIFCALNPGRFFFLSKDGTTSKANHSPSLVPPGSSDLKQKTSPSVFVLMKQKGRSLEPIVTRPLMPDLPRGRVSFGYLSETPTVCFQNALHLAKVSCVPDSSVSAVEDI